MSSAVLSARRRLQWSVVAPLIILAIGAFVYALAYTYYRRHIPVDADGQGYYAYLPAYLLDHDTTFRTVIFRDILPQYHGLYPPSAFGFSLQPKGSYLDKYGVGVAVLLVPFFAVGHLVALAMGLRADGYSNPEVFAVGLAALVYTVLGLFALRALLRRWFSDGVVALVITAVTLGTGAVVYFSWEPLFSHDFAFFAVALTMLCAQRWLEQPASWSRAVALGLAMGTVIAIRLPNVALLIAVPLLGVDGLSSARRRVLVVRQHVRHLVVVAAAAAVTLLPQVGTWYMATGRPVARPYPGESFHFLHPHLVEALVWLQPHGMLPFYPVLGLALVGLCAAWVRYRGLALPVTVAFLVFWYLVSSWWDWAYTDAFGDRAFIDIAPLLALPLAALLASFRNRVIRGALIASGTLLVVITCAMSLAYFQRRLPEDGISAAGYLQLLSDPVRLLGPPAG